MTPRPLDPDTITAKLTLMRETLDALGSVGDVSGDDLRNDVILRAAVERFLILLVDQAVAINLHLAASTGREVARDYRSSFRTAAEVGAIPGELADELAGSAGMRNLLVHEYVRADLDRVAQAVPLAVAGYGHYVREVARFVRHLG